MKYDYVVIGAGVSGISSALLLARFGFKVALLEQAPKAAPLIDGFFRKGVYFEGGFHYAGGLERGGVLDRSLKLLGGGFTPQMVAMSESAYDTVIQPESGFEFSFPQGYTALQGALQDQFPEQSSVIIKFLEELRRATQNLPYYNYRTSLQSLRLAELHGKSLKHVLDELAVFGELRQLLQVHTLLYGARPEEIPFAIHAGVVDGYYRSAATFKGGSRALVEFLLTALKNSGVELFCRHQVNRIELDSADKITGVHCVNGAYLQTSGSISTLHPQAMLNLLPDRVFRPVYRRRLNALTETASANIVFLRCERQRGSTLGVRCERQRGSTLGVRCERQRGSTLGGDGNLTAAAAAGRHKFSGRNFFFLPSSDEGWLDDDWGIDKRLLYLNFSDSGGVDAAAEFGITAILPKFSEEKTNLSPLSYAEQKACIGEDVRQRILTLLPEPGAGLKVECVATRKTLQRINLSPKGSLYGVKHKIGQFNPAAKTRLENFFLAGQAIAAPGLLGAITSAMLAVGEIVGPEKLQALRCETLCDE